MNIFNTIKQHIPTKLRLSLTIAAFVRTIISSLQTLSNDFDAFSNAIRYDLKFDGRVIYLEHWLNDTFDNTLRRIYIVDPSPSNTIPVVVFNYSEGQPSNMIVRNYGETGATAATYNRSELQTRFDFVIKVPFSIGTSVNQKTITAMVNRKKQAGKMFAIQTF